MRSIVAATVVAAAGWLVSACTSSSTSPTEIPIPDGTHRSAITTVTGPGSGGVSVTPKAIPEGTFAADISLLIGNARPNATYVIQRAPEIGRALAADGMCQRALGQSPWSSADPAAPAFVAFALASGPATLTTGANGTGWTNFEFRAPTIPAGTVFDVMFRLVDNETSPTTDLRSGCFTVTVK
jgi:hypothetical protein